ncbi:C6 zinc finger domain protein [Apiospora rasikravindrae]|uniref:C6 zinc finger domain protein n=1 Tax=Apiospora rasikravindrae TaxID=990691 RepID=A0ABR1T5S0_9PEZI
MNDLFSGQDCFLAHPQWQSVMRHHGHGPSDTTTVGSANYKDQVDLVDDYMQLLARVPSAVKNLYMLRAANQDAAAVAKKAAAALDVAEVARIRHSMRHIRDAFELWYQRILPFNPAPAEVPTQDPASIYAMVLRYESPWKGALHMGYWASLCIVYAVLMECQQLSPLDDGDDDDGGGGGDESDDGIYGAGAAAFGPLADRILRSVETVGEGMMGPYRCGYSIRIAYEVVDERIQAWIRMWVGRFEKRYAATAVESYPSPREVFLSPSSAVRGGGEGGDGGLVGG